MPCTNLPEASDQLPFKHARSRTAANAESAELGMAGRDQGFSFKNDEELLR